MYKGLTSFQLKCIAIVTMLIDHIAAVVFVAMYMPFVVDNVIDLTGLENNVVLAFQLSGIFRTIGRIAFPIFCFLIVQGFIHTKNIKKYITRLFLFSILSEVPHDLALYDKVLEFSLQNVIFTLLIGILALCAIKSAEEKYRDNAKLKLIFIAISILIGTLISILIECEYAKVAVTAISLMYLFRELKPLQIVGGALPLITTTPWVIPGFIFIGLYNGKQGIKMKYFFYWFYPVHLFLLYFIVKASP